jgi:hypothetical protein
MLILHCLLTLGPSDLGNARYRNDNVGTRTPGIGYNSTKKVACTNYNMVTPGGYVVKIVSFFGNSLNLVLPHGIKICRIGFANTRFLFFAFLESF